MSFCEVCFGFPTPVLAIFLVGILLFSSEVASEYFVDVINGLDSNDGASLETAFQTVDHAQSLVTSGDTIFLAPGEYAGLVLNDCVYQDWVTWESLNIEANAIFSQFEISFASHVRVRAIKVFNTTSTIEDSTHIEIFNSIFIGPGRHSSDSAFTMSNCSEIVLDGCDISLGNRALATSQMRNSVFRNNQVHGSSGSVMRLGSGSTHLLIENNTIYDANHTVAEELYCNGAAPQPSWGNGECLNGSIYVHGPTENPHENLLILRGARHSIIRGNRMWNSRALGLTLRDEANANPPISGPNNTFENNVVLAGCNFFSGEVTIRNNVCGGMGLGGVSGTFGFSKIRDVVGNLVFGGYFSYITDPGASTPVDLSDANIDWNIVWKVASWGNYLGSNAGNHSIVDPTISASQCIDESMNDCHLKPNAEAIDFGPVSQYARTDRDGHFRVDIEGIGGSVDDLYADVGAYEYGSSSSVPTENFPTTTTRSTLTEHQSSPFIQICVQSWIMFLSLWNLIE